MEDKYENSPTNQKGKVGVRVAIQWLRWILKENSIVECEDWQDVHIEGKDIQALEAEPVPATPEKVAEVARWAEELKEWGANVEGFLAADGDLVYDVGISVDNIEVKNYGYETFVGQKSADEVPCGHVYFPRHASQTNPGISWFQRICYPKLDTTNKSVMPAALVLIFTLDHCPIFSIVFDDIPTLREKVAELIQPLTIEKLNTYSDKEAAEALSGKGIICRSTLLYIPFTYLYDIAYVVLLGHCPGPVDKWWACSEDLQMAKLRHLAAYADKNIINLVEEKSAEQKLPVQTTNAEDVEGSLQL